MILLIVQKQKKMQKEESSTDRNLSIITLMEEVKPKVMKKSEIEHKEMSKSLSLFGNFVLSIFRRKDQDLSFFHWIVFLKHGGGAWALDERI